MTRTFTVICAGGTLMLSFAASVAEGTSPRLGSGLFDIQVPMPGTIEEARSAFVRGDYAIALRLWRSLADQGNAEAQFNLGFMYADGQSVPQNYSEAAKWFRLAAAQGDPAAQFNLGLMYDKGDGVAQNFAEAAKWYRLAADQGVAGAQFNLGVMYFWGRGAPQNFAEAAKWYRLAADQGVAGAQASLGFMYYKGQGVPQNYVSAHMWYSLAAARDYKDAEKARDTIAGRMTPGQIAEAQKQAAEWTPKALNVPAEDTIPLQ
jgi:uncharacterized protein